MEQYCAVATFGDDFVSLSTSLVYSYSAFMVYPHARISRFNNEVKMAWREKLREMYEREDYENILAGAKIVWPLLEFDPLAPYIVQERW